MSDKKLATFATNYIGGYSGANKSSGMITFYDTHVKFGKVFGKGFEIPSENIKSVSVESPDEVGKRVTMTRLVALGVFALLLKKKTNESFIVLELNDGQEVIFNIKGVKPMDMRAKLSPISMSLTA